MIRHLIIFPRLPRVAQRLRLFKKLLIILLLLLLTATNTKAKIPPLSSTEQYTRNIRYKWHLLFNHATNSFIKSWLFSRDFFSVQEIPSRKHEIYKYGNEKWCKRSKNLTQLPTASISRIYTEKSCGRKSVSIPTKKTLDRNKISIECKNYREEV